jgi:putative nucleotidyltransferase with HDIG domain
MNNSYQDNFILFADSDRQYCTQIAEFLSAAGFRTAIANTGIQAIEMLEQMEPQTIVADIRLMAKDDISLFSYIKQHKPFIPLIVTSDQSDTQVSIDALQKGAFDYLVKPFQPEVLFQKVGQALKANRLARENLILSELVSLYDITGKLTSTHDLDQLLDITFKYCLEVAKADSGSLQLFDKENEELVLVRQRNIEVPSPRSPLKNDREWPVSKWVFKNGEPLLLVNGTTVPQTDIALEKNEMYSSVSVPLKMNKETIGIVTLHRSQNSEPFTISDLNSIDVLAAQAGICINNANLYASINQKLSELMLVSNYSEQLMGLVDKYEVIKCLFTTIVNNFALDVVAFLVAQKRSHELLYFSKTPVVKPILHEICKNVVDVFNAASSASINQKRVVIRRVELNETVSNYEIQLPFAFQHIVPVCWEDFKFGAIFFGSSKELNNPNEKLTLLSSLVSQTRIALTNSKLYSDMKENYIRTIKALAIAVDAKDTYTHGHSENVMNIAEEIAKEMNIDEKLVGIIRDAGLLHDIGKIGIPGYILNKPGPLTYEEFNGIMKTHSNLGANIVKDVPFLHDLHKLILHHHEHYNGCGYPEGLRGEQIPVGARILHVADAFEAMTSNRPYRNSLGKTEAIKRLKEGSGQQFDPAVISAFLSIARRKGWIE